MANGCHLITLRLDTALIDDVGRGGVVGEVFLASTSPGRPCRDVLGVLFREWLCPRQARLPSKGGFPPGGILLLSLGLGPLDLPAAPSKVLVSYTWHGLVP